MGEGGDYPKTGFQESYKKDIENMTFKNSFAVTRELMEDAMIGTMKQRANQLITSYGRTRELFGRRCTPAACMAPPLPMAARASSAAAPTA